MQAEHALAYNHNGVIVSGPGLLWPRNIDDSIEIRRDGLKFEHVAGFRSQITVFLQNVNGVADLLQERGRKCVIIGGPETANCASQGAMLRLYGPDLNRDLHQVGSLQYGEVARGCYVGRNKERFKLLLNLDERFQLLEGSSSKGETELAGQRLRLLLCQELLMDLLLDQGRCNIETSSVTQA